MRAPSLCLTFCVLLLGCDGDTPTDASVEAGDSRVDSSTVGNSAARRAALTGMVDGAILPTLIQFRDEAQTLTQSLDALVMMPSDGTRLLAAQTDWQRATSTWQHAEVMLIGPAGAMDLVTGGQDIRDNIYSWPILDPCRVDQELVTADYEDETLFAAENVNVRGLYAMEYLLFVAGEANACDANRPINLDGSWTGVISELPSRRATYAATIARLVLAQATTLVNLWEESYRQTVIDSGQGSEVYPSVQEALNAFSDALFYIDRETKDMKLAEPAGISDLCTFDTCPSRRESKYANVSAEHVASNLRGMRMLLMGGEQNGFDDLLIAVGAEDVWVRMLAALDAAIVIADAQESDFATALASDPMSLDALHTAVRAITDLLKSEFVSTLDLELPQRVEGDND